MRVRLLCQQGPGPFGHGGEVRESMRAPEMPGQEIAENIVLYYNGDSGREAEENI